ncbi:hypothetical protein MNQ98_05090 [Paenibacillus sp. N3/727]|uniref:hypothetical protein n=1 Tax=Paenibacillus sp. N3/727 TaxID=2925845 RepID=UPI001F53C2C0|nr:hypothetical protein [Paenibacillus sp. N3/727]UNK19410.1 hypothetical protein MNQ98_05090 [Paenibacillus sp. N3/727]
MILEIKLAKSLMENEEGMNHLWIQILRDDKVESQKSELDIQLPNGVYRSRNLNGYVENEQEQIVLDVQDKEVMIEIFTQDAIACGEVTISVTLFSRETSVCKKIPIQLVNENEMDLVKIDEQVVERIKELSNTNIPSNSEETNIVFIQPKVLETRDNEFSYLEKKYRVDY